MNSYVANEQSAVTLLRAKATCLVCTYNEPEDIASSRLAVLLAATDAEAKEQCKNHTTMLIKRDLIRQALGYTKHGAIVPVDIETTGKLVQLLKEMFDGRSIED
jgi:hypothetical protein